MIVIVLLLCTLLNDCVASTDGHIEMHKHNWKVHDSDRRNEKNDGYERSEKTLFITPGFIMHLSLRA